MDWNALIDFVGPLSGALAQGHSAGRTGFLRGWSDAQQQHEQDQRQQRLHTEQQQRMGADYLLKIADHLQGIDDPIQYAQFRGAAETAGVKAGYVKPGDLSHLTFPESKTAAKRLKELTDKLGALEAGGYSLDDLAVGGAHLDLGDGTHVPIATAIDLTQRRPMNAAGQAIAKPKKVDTAASTEEERFVARRAKEYGYGSVDDVDSATALQWRSEFRGAGRAEPKPTVPGAGPNDQYGDLLELWKTSHPGQEPPASVRTQLRTQANKVNDKPRELGGMDALYAASDPKAIAAAIIRGDREPETGSLGRPIGAAVDSILAQQGYNKAQAVTDWKATQRHIASMNGPQQLRLNQAINSLPDMLDTVEALSAKWKGGRFPLLNKANLAAAKNGIYGPEVASVATQLEGQIADVVADLGNVYMGGNSPTDHAIGLASKSLSGEWDAKVLKDMIALAKKNVTVRRNSIANTGVSGASADNPYATPVVPTTAPIKVGGFTIVVKP